MEPITTIAGALTLVKAALDSSKSLQELLKKEKPDVTALREHIQMLREQLLNAKDGLLDMREINADLAQQLAELRKEILAPDIPKPVRLNEYYYFAEPDGSYRGPCCSCCWEIGKKRITLSTLQGLQPDRAMVDCKVCKSRFSRMPAKKEDILAALAATRE